MRSCLTIIAIAIAIGAVVSLVGIARLRGLVRRAVQQAQRRSHGRQQRRRAEKIQRDLPASWKDDILKLDGIQDVIPGLVDTISFPEVNGPVVINGWEPETLAFGHINLVATTPKGRMLAKGDKKVVMLGTIVANNLGKNVGDTFDLIENQPVTVVGIFESFSVYDNGSIVMPLAEAQRVLDRADRITGYSIVLTPQGRNRIAEMRKEIEGLILILEGKDRIDTIRKELAQADLAPAVKTRLDKAWGEIAEEIHQTGFTPAIKDRIRTTEKEIQSIAVPAAKTQASSIPFAIKERIRKTSEELLKLDETRSVQALSVREHLNSLVELKLAKAMAWLTSAIALFIGLFGMMNTMVMSVHERTREIGILRAVGWRPRRVLRMVLFEAVALSQLGSLVGILGSFLILKLLTKVPMVNGMIEGRLNLAWPSGASSSPASSASRRHPARHPRRPPAPVGGAAARMMGWERQSPIGPGNGRRAARREPYGSGIRLAQHLLV